MTLGPRSVLLARLDVVSDDLDRAVEALTSDALDSGLQRRVDVRFRADLKALRERHGVLRKLVISRNPKGAGAQVAKLSADAQKVLNECLAFLEGVLFRTAELDKGLCEIADGLIDELDWKTDIKWGRLTIVGEGELFARMAGIIRLRFPEFTVWSLPIAAHEFGHHVADRFESPELAEFIEDEAKRTPKPSDEKLRLGELFADAFAVYSVGPAYAYTTILLDFDPTHSADSETHPSDVKRVHLVLRALEKLNDGGYYGVHSTLTDSWRARAEAAGVAATPDGPTAAAVDFRLTRFLSLLKAQAPLARYKGWPSAVALSQRLGAGSPPSPDGSDIRDVLNAAWDARQRTWTPSGGFATAIERNAFTLCRSLASEKETAGVR